ncbi:hypothetical protein SDC9_135547 [bioreactor metagenome]|uniref:Uncharacterized protein n=1 Tax=bioreactor metagenome TaxID=1076179 RepID=A0A645DHZ8_9ZZZZ
MSIESTALEVVTLLYPVTASTVFGWPSDVINEFVAVLLYPVTAPTNCGVPDMLKKFPAEFNDTILFVPVIDTF